MLLVIIIIWCDGYADGDYGGLRAVGRKLGNGETAAKRMGRDSAGALMPVVASIHLTFNEWRWLLVAALLLTLVMLIHHRLRRYILLPSCIALASVLAAVSVNAGGL